MAKKRNQPVRRYNANDDSSALGMYLEDRLGSSGHRSGLDYLANQREAAYSEGRFIRRLFTGKLRVHNVAAQALMVIFGGFLCLPAFLAILRWLDPSDTLKVQYLFGEPPTFTIFGIVFLLLVTYFGVMLLFTSIMSMQKRRS
jgi:hypothetical protein